MEPLPIGQEIDYLTTQAPFEVVEQVRYDLASLLASGSGRRLEDEHPDRFAHWTSLLPVLTAGMSPGAPNYTERLMSSYDGWPARLLVRLKDSLTQAGEPVLQALVAPPEPEVGKAFRRLAEADLVMRFREEDGSLSVVITAGGESVVSGLLAA